MTTTDRNIIITPATNTNEDPKITFSGADASTGAQNVVMRIYPTDGGTLSFEGSSGQMFSISSNTSDDLFAINDISGYPRLRIDSTGATRVDTPPSTDISTRVATTEYVMKNNYSLAIGGATTYAQTQLTKFSSGIMYVTGYGQLLFNPTTAPAGSSYYTDIVFPSTFIYTPALTVTKFAATQSASHLIESSKISVTPIWVSATNNYASDSSVSSFRVYGYRTAAAADPNAYYTQYFTWTAFGRWLP